MKMCLRNLLLTLCIALSCVSSAAGLIHVSGYEGGQVQVSCPYDQGYEFYEKYLCKNDCGNDDVLITTTEVRKNRYSIHDDKRQRVSTTTISNLRRTDAGKYWCGVTRTGADIYNEVKLEVGQDSCCDQSTKLQAYEESSVSIRCLYESEHQDDQKYFCRGKQPSTCLQNALITSYSSQNGQFRLTDDKRSRTFTVTITSLTQENSGSYLCGVHKNVGLDVFSAYELEVKEWCCVKSKQQSGTVGRPLTLQCPYPTQHRDNRKFLCKGDHRSTCTDMVTHQSRFTMQDDVSSSSFSVRITELKAGDAGTYWCGSDSQWSVGTYTKIQLSVDLPQQTSTEITTTATVVEPVESTHIPEKHIKAATLFYPLVLIVSAVLLVVTFVVVIIIYKYKCHKVQRAAANVSRNRNEAAKTEEVIDVTDIYVNQDVPRSKRRTPKPQSTCQLYDDAEAQEDSVYQNYSTDDIYCNQSFIGTNRR